MNRLRADPEVEQRGSKVRERFFVISDKMTGIWLELSEEEEEEACAWAQAQWEAREASMKGKEDGIPE